MRRTRTSNVPLGISGQEMLTLSTEGIALGSSTRRSVGLGWEAPCPSSEPTLPLEAHTLPGPAWGSCPDSKQELWSQGISLQRKAGTLPALGSFSSLGARSSPTLFPVSQRALSSILCPLRDYFHARAIHAAATPTTALKSLIRFQQGSCSVEPLTRPHRGRALCKTS